MRNQEVTKIGDIMNHILEMLRSGIKPTAAEYYAELYRAIKDGESGLANQLMQYAGRYANSKLAPAIAAAYGAMYEQGLDDTY